jgi:outer membrane biosynthesis protein TonB
MDRAEATGIGVSLAGHLALLAALTLGFATATLPPITNQPIEVSFVDEIGLESAVPQPSAETPAQSVAPEIGAPEEAVPEPMDVPTPPEPAPPAKPVEAKKLAPPPPKQADKPAKPKPAPTETASSAKPSPARAPPKRTDTKAAGKAETTKGSRLGKDFLKGLGLDPTASKSQTPTGAVMSAAAMTGIVAAIQRQIQPCADRQVNPGPGANRISVKLNLKLNRDGSLAAKPVVVGVNGVDDENDRYQKRVADLAIAAFTGCSPLRDLPPDLYDTPRGGWSNFNMNYKLPG